MASYFIADNHWHHKNIIRFDERPFSSVEEMNKEMIKRWNSVVTSNDTVYILGDFCMSKDERDWIHILSELKGHKVLIKGNHDLRQMSPELRKHFVKICDYLEMKENGNTIIMSHYPIMAYKKSYSHNVYMLHGHTHETKEQEWIEKWTEELRAYHGMDSDNAHADNLGQIINVGCMRDYMDYTPRTLDYLINNI